MRKYLFFISFLLLAVLSNNSCTDPVDECEGVECGNGQCEQGNCKCDYGWSGSDCSSKRITPLIGDWTGELKCLTNTDTITLRIKEIGNSVDVLKINTVDLVFNIGTTPLSFDSFTMNAIVDSSFNSFVIDTLEIKQNFNDQELLVLVSGDGKKIEGDKLNLNLNFTLKNQGIGFKCTGVFDK